MSDSALVEIAVEELRGQRTFLSSDEAAALTLPADLDDEDNLALDRVRRRRLWIYTALRDRFIGDGRPFDDWLATIESEEQRAGGETLITRLARQVLEWSVRTGDRALMFWGFAAKAMRWFGLILLFLAGWSWYQDAETLVVGTVGVLGAVLLVGSAVAGRTAAARASALLVGLRPPPAARPPGAAEPV
jgi:hypothetical protein